MESGRFLECLEGDYRRLREVVPGHLEAGVPTCPDWQVADLIRHMAEVYLHKVEIMRHGKQPQKWPPAWIGSADALSLLDRAYGELSGEFDSRKPEDPCWTFYGPDQTVRFWVRRMAQETVIHRIDAELGVGTVVAPVPSDLAVDGIDELLQIFVGWAFTQWPADFTPVLEKSPGRTFLIRADATAGNPGASWLVRTGPGQLTVEGGPGAEIDPAAQPDVTVAGLPPALLRWAWNRGPRDHGGSGQAGKLTITGDSAALAELRACVVEGTQ